MTDSLYISDIARLAGVSTNAVWRWMSKGLLHKGTRIKLPFLKMGRTPVFKPEDVEWFFRQLGQSREEARRDPDRPIPVVEREDKGRELRIEKAKNYLKEKGII